MLKTGTEAPDFTLAGHDGTDHRLSDYRGRRVILYFYPKDNTPGCTNEACSLRDNKPSFDAMDTVIIGVSKDSVESHRRFIEKQGLNFLLLSDPDHQVMETYGAWGEKISYGKKSIGTIRCTYIIDKDGIIEKVYSKVSTATHGSDILKFLESLEA